MNKYDDIINLTRPNSKHPHMTLEQRSAQFAPFAALTGYEGQIKETARLTDKKLELDEEAKSMTSQNRREARRNLKGHENRIIQHCAKSKFCANRSRKNTTEPLPTSTPAYIKALCI